MSVVNNRVVVSEVSEYVSDREFRYINRVDSFSDRMDFAKFVPYVDGVGFDILSNNILIQGIRSLPVLGEYTVRFEAGRMDLLSKSLYGVSDFRYWYALMLYNDFMTWEDLLDGMRIRYFDIRDLNNLILKLSL